MKQLDPSLDVPADAWAVAECRYTEVDVRQYLRLAQQRMRRRTWRMAVGIMLVLFGFNFALMYLRAVRASKAPIASPGNLNYALGVYGSAIWPYLAALFPIFYAVRWWQRRVFARRVMMRAGPLRRPRAFIFTPRGVSIREPLAALEYHWQAFAEWRETKGLFVLYLSENVAELVQKNALGDATAQDLFRGTLRGCIDANRMAQQAFPVEVTHAI